MLFPPTSPIVPAHHRRLSGARAAVQSLPRFDIWFGNTSNSAPSPAPRPGGFMQADYSLALDFFGSFSSLLGWLNGVFLPPHLPFAAVRHRDECGAELQGDTGHLLRFPDENSSFSSRGAARGLRMVLPARGEPGMPLAVPPSCGEGGGDAVPALVSCFMNKQSRSASPGCWELSVRALQSSELAAQNP